MRLSPDKFYRGAKLVFAALVLLLALIAGLHTVADSDMGWHLATGRWIVQHHQIPRTDVLSFSSRGTPWTYPPFAGVLLFLVYKWIGYTGLSWFCALACLATVAILMRRGGFAVTMLAMLAIPSLAARTAPRADLFSTVFFALLLTELWAYQRGRSTRLWLMPVLMFFWVNLHPGFVAGVGAIGAYLLMELSDFCFLALRRAEIRQRMQRIWPWLVASLAATLVNPWGAGIYEATLGLLGVIGPAQEKINGNIAIAELLGIPVLAHPLQQLMDLRNIQNGFYWLLLLSLIFSGLFLWKRKIGVVLVILVTTQVTLTHARYAGLFVIVVVTLGATVLEELCTRSSAAPVKSAGSLLLRVPVVVACLATVLFCLVTVLHAADYVSNRTYVMFSPEVSFGSGASSWFPARAAAFIQRQQLPGNVFEDYEVGGYAAWSLGPEYPDFIDGRGNNPDLVMEQFNLYSEDPDSAAWQIEADHRNLNVLLVATTEMRGMQTMDPYKFCQSAAWRPVYMDDVSLVFLRNTPQNAPWIDRLQINCFTQPLTAPSSTSRSALHQFYLNAGGLLYDLHRDREAKELLRIAATLYREDPDVHFLNALLLERNSQSFEAEKEYRISLAIKDSGAVWYSLSKLYGSQHRYTDALHALQHAAELSSQPFNIYMTTGKLQLLLGQPEQALVSFAEAEKSSPYRNGAESLAPEAYAELAESRSESHRLLGHLNEAIAFQQEAIKKTPMVVRRWDRLSRLYEASGQMPQASQVRGHIAELQMQESSKTWVQATK